MRRVVARDVEGRPALVLDCPGLSGRQMEVLAHIWGYWQQKGYAPSVRDLCKSLSIQPNAVAGHLKILRRKGWLEAVPGSSTGRTTRLTQPLMWREA